jgi:transcription elongation factor B subunit 1
MVSGTIKAMLGGALAPLLSRVDTILICVTAGQFAESRGEIRFPEISTAILEKVIQYMYYKVRAVDYPP